MLFKTVVIFLLLFILLLLFRALTKKRYTYLDYTAYYTDKGKETSLRDYVVSYRDDLKDGIQSDKITGNFTNSSWMARQHIDSKNEAWRQERIRKFFNKS